MGDKREDVHGERALGQAEHSHAHVFRIRLDAEGTSASAIEEYFGSIIARLQEGTGFPMNVSSQVIEMADNAMVGDALSVKRDEGDPPLTREFISPYRGVWYRGRLTLAPSLQAQGCDEERGDRIAYGEQSVPAVYDAVAFKSDSED